MLVERPLRPIRFLADLDGAPIVPFYFARGPPETFFPVFLIAASFLDLLCFFLRIEGEYLQLSHAHGQIAALADEFLHLGGEDHIC